MGARALLAKTVQLLETLPFSDVCKELDKHHETISHLAYRAMKDEVFRAITDEVLESIL